MRIEQLVQAVKDHALSHYNDGGWDVVVECFEDHEIREAIEGCSSAAEAISRLAAAVSVWAEREAQADAEAWGTVGDDGDEWWVPTEDEWFPPSQARHQAGWKQC